MRLCLIDEARAQHRLGQFREVSIRLPLQKTEVGTTVWRTAKQVSRTGPDGLLQEPQVEEVLQDLRFLREVAVLVQDLRDGVAHPPRCEPSQLMLLQNAG